MHPISGDSRRYRDQQNVTMQFVHAASFDRRRLSGHRHGGGRRGLVDSDARLGVATRIWLLRGGRRVPPGPSLRVPRDRDVLRLLHRHWNRQRRRRGACTPNSNNVRCGFDAAAPLLIFGYFIGPTIVGALSRGFVRTSRVVLASAQGAFEPRDPGTLLLGHTIVVALAAATTAFVGFAPVPLHGARLFLPALAACVAFGLTPSYGADDVTVPATPRRAPSW